MIGKIGQASSKKGEDKNRRWKKGDVLGEGWQQEEIKVLNWLETWKHELVEGRP